MSEVKSIANFFKENNYVVINKLISDEMCTLFYQYIKTSASSIDYKITYDKNSYDGYWDGVFGDTQIENSFCRYGDPLFDSLMSLLQKNIEDKLDLKLSHNYSYYRLYQTKNVLREHIDRESCEISLTIPVGYDISNVDKTKYDNYSWPIWLENNKKESLPVALKPGDVLIYRGYKLKHWREEFLGLNQAQVFMHYNEKNGQFDISADNRPMIGLPKKETIYIKDYLKD